MGHRDVAFATTRVELTEAYWADVRPLTGTEQIVVNHALTNGPITSVNTNTKYELNDEAYIQAALTAIIVKWNLDDEHGVLLPITDDTVLCELNAREQQILMRVYRRMNTPLSDEEVLQGQP